MNKTILIIETDAVVHQAAASALSAAGYSVDVSSDLKSPVEIVRQKMPHLLVMGIELSASQNGYILCSRLKKDEQLKAIPLILIGNPAGFEGHKKLKTRADEYVAKPIETGDLLARVRRLLNEPEINDSPVSNLDELIEVTLSDSVVIPHPEESVVNLESTQVMKSVPVVEEIPSTETEEPAEGWFAQTTPPLMPVEEDDLSDEVDALTVQLRESQEQAASHKARIRELEAEVLNLRSQQHGFGFTGGQEMTDEQKEPPVDLQTTLDLRHAIAQGSLGETEIDFSWVLAENHELKKRVSELEESVLQAEDRMTQMYFRMKNEESLRLRAMRSASLDASTSSEDASP